MARPKGQPKLGGRKKGTPNVVSRDAQENILSVFLCIGGLKQMAEWARENQTEFYKIYAKLLPKNIEMKVDSEMTYAQWCEQQLLANKSKDNNINIH